MRNLLKETIEFINDIDKIIEDISWIGSRDGQYAITWDEFKEIADIEYNSGFGAQEIAQDLVIVFKDNTHCDRGEYDGSEWWAYHEVPIKMDKSRKFKLLAAKQIGKIGWRSLYDLNKTTADRVAEEI